LSAKKLGTPAILTGALALVSVILLLLEPAWINPRVREYLLAAILVSGGIVFVRTVNFFLFDILFRKRKGREAPQLLRMVVSIICYSGLFVLNYTFVFGKSVAGLLATSAVLSVILGWRCRTRWAISLRAFRFTSSSRSISAILCAWRI